MDDWHINHRFIRLGIAKSTPETDSLYIPVQYSFKWNSFGAYSSADAVECETIALMSHSCAPVDQSPLPNITTPGRKISWLDYGTQTESCLVGWHTIHPSTGRKQFWLRRLLCELVLILIQQTTYRPLWGH